MSLATYVSQLGPDGLGHDRCGQACLTSVLLDKGWDSDPVLLMQELVSTPPSRPDEGTTANDLISLAQQKGFDATPFTFWHEATDALRDGHAVLALVDNAYLRPTAYPNAPGWRALHWIRVLQLVPPSDPAADLAICEDPLTYLPQPSGSPYQGPTLYLTSSIRAAIEATPVPYAGIIVSRGDDSPLTPTPQEPAPPDQEPAP